MKKKTCAKKIRDKTKSIDKETISYRLKCEKTANGLSHYVMYGDVQKKSALL